MTTSTAPAAPDAASASVPAQPAPPAQATPQQAQAEDDWLTGAQACAIEDGEACEACQ